MKRCFLFLLGTLFLLAISCKKDVDKSTEKQLLEFSIGALGGNSQGVVDETTKTVTLKADAGTDVTKLVPIMKISEGASVSPANGVAQDFTNPVTYTVIAEDGSKQVYTVKVEVAKSSEKAILSFKLSGLKPEVEGKIDETNKKIALTVPSETNVKELVPSIAISKGASVSPSTDLKQDFTKPVTYTVTAEDGSKQAYSVEVVVEKGSDKAILSFKFSGLKPEVEGKIDETNKKIALTVPSDINVKELVPSISISKGATVSPATDLKQDFTKPVTYTVTAEDGTKQEYEVSVIVVKNNDAKVLSFKFANPDAKAVIDHEAKTIKIQVPYGTDVTKLIPVVEISDKATISPVADAATNFTNAVTYKVTSESKEVSNTYTVTVEVQKFKTEIGNLSSKSFGPSDVVTITGNFLPKETTASLTSDDNDCNLEIVSCSATELKVKVPETAKAGTYSLKVVSGSVAAVVEGITIVDPNAPVITGVDKQSYTRGLDGITITGRNLKPKGWASYIWFGNHGYAANVNEEGTEISIIVPIDAPVGNIDVKVMTNNDPDICSNSLKVTINENTNPKPMISGISSSNIFVGDVLEIKGTNFAKSRNKVWLKISGSDMGQRLDIIEECETSIKVSTLGVNAGQSYDLEVTSNGQETKYTTPIKVELGTAVVTSVTPTTLKAGESILVKGKYFYSDEVTVMIDDSYAQFDIKDLENITVQTSRLMDKGEHTLYIKSRDYYNPKVFHSQKFTVVEDPKGSDE